MQCSLALLYGAVHTFFFPFSVLILQKKIVKSMLKLPSYTVPN